MHLQTDLTSGHQMLMYFSHANQHITQKRPLFWRAIHDLVVTSLLILRQVELILLYKWSAVP